MSTENTSPDVPAESSSATPDEQPNSSADSQGQEGQAPQNPAPSNPENKPRVRDAQHRIGQLVYQRQEAERRAAELEARLAAYERDQQHAQARQQLDASEPNPDQFPDLRSYMAAVSAWTEQRATLKATADWERRMEENAARQAQLAARDFATMQAQQAEQTELQTRFVEAVKKYPDYIDKVNNPELPSIRGTHAYQALMRLPKEKFVDASYALANNPMELERLGMIPDPYVASQEIHALVSKLSGPAVTSAPPPPPNRTGNAATGPKDWRQMTTAEHVKAYREAKHKRRFG